MAVKGGTCRGQRGGEKKEIVGKSTCDKTEIQQRGLNIVGKNTLVPQTWNSHPEY